MSWCCLNNRTPFFSSKVTPSGPKGLVKSDVMNYIVTNNLKPVQVAKPEEKEKPVPKPVPAKPEAPKAQYQVG
jgi:hypothetical protein